MENQTAHHVNLYLQPNFETDTTDYVQHWQMNRLNQIPLLFYQFTLMKNTVDTLPAVPDGCLDIIFCCNEATPTVHVFGTVLTCTFVPFTPGETYFGVRIPPGYGIKSKNFNIKDLISTHMPLSDLSNDINPRIDCMLSHKNFYERIRIFETTIGTLITPTTKDHQLTNYLLDTIITHNGNITLKQVTNSVGYSDKYIRNKFTNSIGISPKNFSKIIRFQKSLYMLRRGMEIDDIVYKNGYFDQSHLINDFRNFGYFSPREFITYIHQMKEMQNW
ncbi:helix-turn-helix domain-containing protein [Aquibacillus sediminis]|uniref:helix-turn-helix domain-containing protein n=1 Tax=Aquibacillus sediminis TaxID=2574734 RepID=UPI001107E136|nr:helix-turn-helix domain-containing protein [Aquibacillus sediminis]